MVNKKLVLSIILFLCLILTAVFFALVSNHTNISKNQKSIEDISFYDDYNPLISDVLTFDELIDEISKDNHIAKGEASKQIISNFSNTSNDTSISPTSASYRKLSTSFIVDASFKPSINFYCLTDESDGNFKAIKKILTIGIDENYDDISKKFAGTVYSNLENTKVVYFNMNGDFYNKGTTNIEIIENLSTADAVTVSFDLLYPNKPYKYINKEGRLSL